MSPTVAREVTRRCTRDDALRAARGHFLAGDRLDVRALATELGLSRMTLYRWFGDRDGLLGAVLSDLFDETVEAARQQVRARGRERLVQIVERANAAIARSRPLAHYLNSEPESALRVLTSAASPVQARAVAVWRSLLEEAVASGEVTLRLAPEPLAQVLVRVGQSFLWPELLVGARADTSGSAEVYRALLS